MSTKFPVGASSSSGGLTRRRLGGVVAAGLVSTPAIIGKARAAGVLKISKIEAADRPLRALRHPLPRRRLARRCRYQRQGRPRREGRKVHHRDHDRRHGERRPPGDHALPPICRRPLVHRQSRPRQLRRLRASHAPRRPGPNATRRGRLGRADQAMEHLGLPHQPGGDHRRPRPPEDRRGQGKGETPRRHLRPDAGRTGRRRRGLQARGRRARL